MLLFLNLDCVLVIPADALGPRGNGADGVHRVERLANDFPSLRIVATGERRYRMTLAHLRGFFSAETGRRLVATTLLYRPGARSQFSRLDEIDDWLGVSGHAGEDWIALDDRPRDFAQAPERVIACATFTEGVASTLRCALRRRADAEGAAGSTGLAPASLLVSAAAAHTDLLRAR